MSIDMNEIIGIIASLIVLLSFAQPNEIRIRLVNSIGSTLFVIYGILIGSISVWFLNGVCVIVNAIKILKERKSKANKESE